MTTRQQVTITSTTSGRQWHGEVLQQNGHGRYVKTEEGVIRWFPEDWIKDE